MTDEPVRRRRLKEEEVSKDAQTEWLEQEQRARELLELAALPTLEYEKRRASSAKEMGVRVSVLDEEVRKLRDAATELEEEENARSRFKVSEPWPDPVEGKALTEELVAIYRRYCVLPEHAEVVLALWTILSFAYDAFAISPRLQVCSPAHRSGKSTVLDVLEYTSRRALRADHLTMPVVFRLVDKDHPTLLVDDAHRYLKRNEELQGVLGSGHRRGGVYFRVEGESRDVREYSTWGPVAIALIGKLPPELNDRSITIPMMRKYTTDKIRRLIPGNDPFVDLRRKIARWVLDNMEDLRNAKPRTLETLHDRARDNWRPLFAIAELVGFAARARAAAKSIEAYADDDDADALMLLEDIRIYLQGRKVEAFTSKHLIEWLVKLEHRPWAEYGSHEKHITPHAISKLITPFRIVPPKKPKVLIDGVRVRGYYAKWFADAFERYLPDLPSPIP